MGMAAEMMAKRRKMKRIVSACARLMRVLVVQMLVALLMKVPLLLLLLLWLLPHQVDGLGGDVPACCFE